MHVHEGQHSSRPITGAGFVQVMENLESHGIYCFDFLAWKVIGFTLRSWKSNMLSENKKGKKLKK